MRLKQHFPTFLLSYRSNVHCCAERKKTALEILLNDTRCSQMFQVLDCHEMLPSAPDALGCVQALPDTPRCAAALECPRCAQMRPDAPRCTQMCFVITENLNYSCTLSFEFGRPAFVTTTLFYLNEINTLGTNFGDYVRTLSSGGITIIPSRTDSI